MPRPRIPAETARQVLVESGHRCAVCGAPCPLVYAHIVPWKRTRDHSPENLICLCANCHERADRERWGEKALKMYKAAPWVHRQFSRRPVEPELELVELMVRMEMQDFNSNQAQMLRYAVAKFLDVDPKDVKIVAKRAGSVRVFLQLPAEEARRLDRAFREDRDSLQRSLPLFPIDEARALLSGSLSTDAISPGQANDQILDLVRATIDTLPPRLKQLLSFELVEGLSAEKTMERLGLRSLRELRHLRRKAFEELRRRLIDAL